MWNLKSLQCCRMPSFLAIADFLRPQSLELGSTFIYGVRISFESFSGVVIAPDRSLAGGSDPLTNEIVGQLLQEMDGIQAHDSSTARLPYKNGNEKLVHL